MPNWCANKLTITGDPGAVEKFVNAARGFEPSHEPECAQCKRSKHEHGKDGKCLFGSGVYVRPPAADDRPGRERIEQALCFHSTVPVPSHVIDSPFDPVGYDWRLKNWGTKWGACDDRVEYEPGSGTATYTFDTAWAPPLDWLQGTCGDYPELRFELEYYESGMGFAGCLICAQGSDESHTEYDWDEWVQENHPEWLEEEEDDADNYVGSGIFMRVAVYRET